MKATTLDKLIWVFIYGGLLGVGLGLSISRNESALGWTLAIAGGVAAVIGAALVYVRSRVNEKP